MALFSWLSYNSENIFPKVPKVFFLRSDFRFCCPFSKFFVRFAALTFCHATVEKILICQTKKYGIKIGQTQTTIFRCKGHFVRDRITQKHSFVLFGGKNKKKTSRKKTKLSLARSKKKLFVHILPSPRIKSARFWSDLNKERRTSAARCGIATRRERGCVRRGVETRSVDRGRQ